METVIFMTDSAIVSAIETGKINVMFLCRSKHPDHLGRWEWYNNKVEPHEWVVGQDFRDCVNHLMTQSVNPSK